jgi:hypothetical protein
LALELLWFWISSCQRYQNDSNADTAERKHVNPWFYRVGSGKGCEEDDGTKEGEEYTRTP